MSEKPAETYWHLDKRVPVATLLVFLAQLAAILIWGTRIDERVTQVERRLEGGVVRSTAMSSQLQSQGTAIEVLAAEMRHTNEELKELNELLRDYVRGNGG